MPLRAVTQVLYLERLRFGLHGRLPDWTSGRCWLLRLGLAALLRPKPRADDWAWLIDYSAQLGVQRCLVVLGVPLHQWQPGRPLGFADLQLLHLRVLSDTSKERVALELKSLAVLLGPPRQIVNDYGADLHGGVGLFRQGHPSTSETYDVAHKAACLLRHLLEGDERWAGFSTQAARCKSAVQQTELAYLVPPGQRRKARYMNLGPLLRWGEQTLVLLHEQPAERLQGVSPCRLETKLAWLYDYQEALAEWGQWQRVLETAVAWVERQGLYEGVEVDVKEQLQPLVESASSAKLAGQVTQFLSEQSLAVRGGERLLGSTTVLESCFGKLKDLQKNHSKGGFSALVLGLGALVGHLTEEAVAWALEHCPVKRVLAWCRRNLGTTVHAQRQIAFHGL